MEVVCSAEGLSTRATEGMRKRPTCQIVKSPTALRRLDHIVAGHTVQGKAAMLGALGVLYKPVQKGEKGQREVNFYEQAERLCPQLGPFLPAFHGTHIFHAMRYLAMEDIAIRFNEPCVLDIKIGVRTYEPTASREKVESELSKCPAQAAVGFRPCGMRVYGTHSRQYRCRNKDWGRAITTQTAPSLLAEFVCDDDESSTVRRIRRVVPPLVKRLRELEAVMCAIEGLRFFASSVVIVYEGREGDARRGEAEEAHAHARIDLRMVDFAHWVRAESGIDDNYLTGLRNVIAIFDDIAEQAASFARNMEGTVSLLPQFQADAVPPLSRDPSSAGDDAPAASAADADVAQASAPARASAPRRGTRAAPRRERGADVEREQASPSHGDGAPSFAENETVRHRWYE
ncbi:hypothetical protein KFE25_007047 [Diacronema lutheri]|uniref:Kinase n=1 Tax=Diacronema lutheri TaxID=2081491 RepID=A0A8J5XYU3_DIALT|nr:hypothetical protein KFE25_007047 [Diacronema lutheri]